jgi:hypothetical protein
MAKVITDNIFVNYSCTWHVVPMPLPLYTALTIHRFATNAGVYQFKSFREWHTPCVLPPIGQLP